MSKHLASTNLPMNKVNLDDTAKAFHIPNWKDYDDHQRMAFLRKVAQEGGRDPRIATLCIKIFRDNDVKVRNYKGQAAAILKWVQENMYYINEPGERLQDPIYTLRTGYGDCDDLAILLAAMFESIRLPFRYVLSGKNRETKEVDRWIEGTPMKPIDFSHIYVVVGDRPFGKPKWHYAEPTLKGVQLGWDVVKHHRYNGNSALPELAGSDNMQEKHKLLLPLPMKNEILSFMDWTESDLNIHPKTIWNDVKKSITPRRIIVGLVAGIIIGATIDKLLYETGIVKKPKTRYEHDRESDFGYDSDDNT